MVAQRNWIREWWDKQRDHYQLVTSLPVIEELERGDYPNKDQVLDLVVDIPLLSILMEVCDIVKTYIKGMGRGTGLGLASVCGIIKAHGGYIDVESKKGNGTIFSIYLPASHKKGTHRREGVT